ncbi:MAG TPA: CRTAC1 family protein [Bryobacteraceae bacterium]|nr:CRTAC1 family protein [Bryobacteraceae bacterium]
MKTLLALLLVAGAALVYSAQRPVLPVFTDITNESGITFKHAYGDHHLDNIVEGTGAGVCIFDYDNDGLPDIYFVTGTWTQGVSDNEGRDLRGKLSNRLYKNLGNGHFADVTDKAGVGGQGIFSTGCSAADYDNDGYVDLYVLNYGRNILYHNNGDGTFTDVTGKSGMANNRWSLSAVWLDYNNDGWLDAYVCNYLQYDEGRFRDFYAADGYPGPLSYNGQPNMLYRNNGDGTFTDVTKEAGLWKPGGRCMSASAADFGNRGRMDIWSSNDAMESYYFENTGKGAFAEKALEMNMAYGENGQGVSSMGPFPGDVNRDGWMDVFVPNLNYCILFMNAGKEGFVDRTLQAGLSQVMGQYVGWAGILLDYDNDGWLDIFTTHGDAHHEFVQEDTLMRNRGDGTFEDVSRQSGPYFFEKYVGRGAAWGDLDNDGDIDLVIVNLNDSPRILRNDGGNRNHWLTVEPLLKFPTGSRLAIGARVTVTSGSLRQIEDVNPVRGFLSTGDGRVHFGLAEAEHADVEIRWPDGKTDRFPAVKANQFLKYVHEATAAAPKTNGVKP